LAQLRNDICAAADQTMPRLQANQPSYIFSALPFLSQTQPATLRSQLHVHKQMTALHTILRDYPCQDPLRFLQDLPSVVGSVGTFISRRIPPAGLVPCPDCPCHSTRSKCLGPLSPHLTLLVNAHLTSSHCGAGAGASTLRCLWSPSGHPRLNLVI
jgi:hypothetical protein